MTEEQITLLKKALELYSLSIDHRPFKDESDEFYEMKIALSELIGIDVT